MAVLYVLVGAVVIPVAASLFRRPQRGILVLVGLVPFDGVLQLLPHASVLRSWKEVLVGLTLLATFAAPASERAPRRALPGWWPALVGLVVLAVGSAVVVAAGGNVTQAFTGVRIEFFYLLAAWAIWRCPLAARDRDRAVTAVMATTVLTALVGLAQEAVGPARLHSFGYAYNSTIRFTGGHLRAFSTFTYQSPFAYFVMFGILLGACQFVAEPGRPRNRGFVLTLPVVLGGLFFTFERGAWIGLAAGCLYLGLRHHRRLLLVLPIGAVGFLYLPKTFSVAALSSTSLGERSAGWGANLGQLYAHPLGVGIGATGAAAERVASLQGTGAAALAAAVYQPDNYYFKTTYELGVLGLWMLVLVLVGLLVSADRTALALDGRDRALAAGVSAFVLAAMVTSAVATFFEIFPMDALTWVFVTVVATMAAAGAAPPEPAARSEPETPVHLHRLFGG